MKTTVANILMIGTLLLWSCDNTESIKPNSLRFIGKWEFDQKTIEKLHRSCLLFNFTDSVAGFQIDKHKDDLVLKLTNESSTSWHSSLKNNNFNSKQILKTTKEMGRFCGYQTEARLILFFKGTSSHTLYGKIKTPDCDICPEIELVCNKS